MSNGWNARLAAADAVFAVSDADAAIYRREQHLNRVHVLPNGLDTDLYRPTNLPAEPGSLVFTGSYGYWPNEAAALHLIAMSQAPDAARRRASRYLVGRDPSRGHDLGGALGAARDHHRAGGRHPAPSSPAPP